MLNRTRRYVIYVLVTVGFAFLGAFTSALAPSYFWGLIFGTLGLILSIVLELYIELAVREEPPLRVMSNEDEVKEIIRKLKTDPSLRTFKAVWCTRWAYTPEYFDEENAILRRNPRLHIQRLINPDRMGRDNFEAHIQSSKTLLDQGKYEIRNTNMKEFEFGIWEFEKPTGIEHKAIFTFIDIASNTFSLSLFLDPTKHENVHSVVTALESWFEHEWLASAQNI